MFKIRIYTKLQNKLFVCIRCDNSTTAPNRQQQQQLCEGDSGNDTITKVPVVLKTNQHIIFKNIFCAFCHDYKLKDLDTKVFYYGYDTNLSFSSYDALERDIEQNGRILQQDESTNINLLCTCTPTDLVKNSTLGLYYNWERTLSSCVQTSCDKNSNQAEKCNNTFPSFLFFR